MSAYVGGEVAGFLFLPKVLGMILSGILLSNLTKLDFNPFVSSLLRNIALTTILIEGGLGLDPLVLAQTSGLCLRLCFIPLITDTVVMGVLGRFVLGLPWVWSLMLGFILSAACAAIIVPAMMTLTRNNLGVQKGIPSILLAASSMDDVIAIAGFGVMLGFAFRVEDVDPSQANFYGVQIWDMAKGPVEIMLGIAIGFFYGNFIGLLPFETLVHSCESDEIDLEYKSRDIKLVRLSLLLFGGLTSVFVSEGLNLSGIGPLSALTIAFFAGLRLRKVTSTTELASSIDIIWVLTKPFLFGLIGTEVVIASDDGSLEVGYNIIYCVIVVVIGMLIRILATYLSLLGGTLDWREKLYISIAWLSKAAVQATIGPIALDYARKRNLTAETEYGRTVVLVSVIAVLLSAPIGTFCMKFLAERCLSEPPPSYRESVHDSGREIRVSSIPIMMSDFVSPKASGRRNSRSTSNSQ